jgi:hypothetical protein|tara:strand:- start:22 stop:627 length:606 start_codon:yes stop_codon:yes gene_type:complete
MHKPNVLIIGPNSFISTLNELKRFLKFNMYFDVSNINFDTIIFHHDVLKDKEKKLIVENAKVWKICAQSKKVKKNNKETYLELPTSLKEINSIVENVLAKKIFNKNSSIKIKEYFLDKNEKKLTKNDNFVILTEKEIQLLELFLNQKKPISKKKILSFVWNYSDEADTHTVETHIYRLRKKINEKFLDMKFILNNKDGYFV